MRYDYVVIGAGVSGISSALLLARFGRRVAILEQAARPAPLIGGFERDGVYYDGGFHYAGGLEKGGVLDCNLRLLGLAGELSRLELAKSGYDTVIQPESSFKFSFPQGYAALQTALSHKFPAQSAIIADYLEDLRAATRKLPYYHEAAPLSSLNLAEIHGQSLKQVLDKSGFAGDLRNLLEVHGLLYGARPEEIPFAIHAGVVDGYYRSAATFKGGGRALVKTLVKALDRSGVDLFCRHQVSEIVLSPAGKIAGVNCADGRCLQASGCIATLHPQAMLKLLPDTVLRPVYRRRLNGLAETPSADIVFMRCELKRGSAPGVRGELERGSTSGLCGARRGRGGLVKPAGEKACRRHKFAGRNFFFLPPRGEVLLDFKLPQDKRLLYLNFSAANATEICGLTAILPALSGVDEKTGGSDAYAERKAYIGELVRQRIANLLPEIGAKLTVAGVATGKTLKRINLSPKGSLYGVKHKVGQFNPVPKTRLENFFLAGQAIAAPGVLGAITSALMTVGEIVGHEKIQALRHEVICDDE